MKWFNIIAGVATIHLSFVWYFEGFNALPEFWVYGMLILSILETIRDGVLASFGYKLKTNVVKIGE